MVQIKRGIHLLVIVECLTIGSIFATPFTPSLQPSLYNISSLEHVSACTRSSQWVQTTIKPEDCIEALELFRRAEGQKSDQQRFEFLAPGAKQQTHLLPLQTPRKYYYRSCTVALVMMVTFRISNLPPNARRKTYLRTEVDTLGDLKLAASEIVGQCVNVNGIGGWKAMGRLDQALGVFLWESGSSMDVNLIS